jgi:hypothetical protein
VVDLGKHATSLPDRCGLRGPFLTDRAGNLPDFPGRSDRNRRSAKSALDSMLVGIFFRKTGIQPGAKRRFSHRSLPSGRPKAGPGGGLCAGMLFREML